MAAESHESTRPPSLVSTASTLDPPREQDMHPKLEDTVSTQPSVSEMTNAEVTGSEPEGDHDEPDECDSHVHSEEENDGIGSH